MWVSAGAADASYANDVCRRQGLQGRVMWMDAEANVWALASRSRVAAIMNKCKAANINLVIVDVKPLAGLTLYNSKIAPKLTRFKGGTYPKNYDLLRTVVEEGHRVGIPVHAAVNVFSEGSKVLPGGPAYDHPDWQCVHYEVRWFLHAGDEEFELLSSDAGLPIDEVRLYAESSDPDAVLPEGTFYIAVNSSGTPAQYGLISGSPKIAAPEDGYVLVGYGRAADWLRQAAEDGTQLRLEGREVMTRSGDLDSIHHAVFVNPLHPEARAYALSIAREICENYAIDGLVLDRMRYPGLYADFSDITRKAFEQYIEKPVENWPADVFRRDPAPGKGIIRGPLFGSWLKFRAKVMRDYLAEVRQLVKSIKPDVKLGIYVGSWYPMYYDVGVNWGSRSNAAGYEWWPEGYEETGYADLVDYMMTGCYYTYPTRKEAAARGDEEWKSVEASAEESVNAVKDDTFVYASLYLLQYKGRPHKFIEAIQQSMKGSQGCMLFDLVYVRKYDWWGVLKKAFSEPAKAPHDVPGALAKIRNRAQQQAKR